MPTDIGTKVTANILIRSMKQNIVMMLTFGPRGESAQVPKKHMATTQIGD